MDQLASLLRRMERLEAERDVVRTIARYAEAIDYGLDARWVDCFTADGVFEVRPRGGHSFQVTGREALGSFIAGHTKAPSRWHKHLVTQQVVEVAEGTASAQSYILRVDEDDDGQAKIWVFGRYLDRLVYEADGQWRFRHRTIELEGAQPAAWAPLRGDQAYAAP